MSDIIQDRKVFCVNCAYFNACKKNRARIQIDDINIHEICSAPQNIRPTYLSDGSNKFISAPSIINKYNNCTWFVSKTTPPDIAHVINLHNKDPKAHQAILEPFKEEVNQKVETAENFIREEVGKVHRGLHHMDHRVSMLSDSIHSESLRAINKENSILSKVNEEASNAKAYTDTTAVELREEITEKTKILWKYKGSVNYRSDLDEIVEKEYGDVYNVRFDEQDHEWGHNFVWTEQDGWDDIGGFIYLEDYYNKFQINSLLTILRDQITQGYTNADNVLQNSIDSLIAQIDNKVSKFNSTDSADLSSEDGIVNAIKMILIKMGMNESKIIVP